ncbi:Sulfate adenylyltransferase subunit 1 [Streptomyces tendae]
MPAIYYADEREVFARGSMWLTAGEWGGPKDGETVEKRKVRYRTVGDMSCTRAVDSDADSIEKVIAEIAVSRLTERGATRADDKMSEAAMEDRKREGYFLTMTSTTEPIVPAVPAESAEALSVWQLSETTLLRFATAGSVDDGKSTLVGRLLHDQSSSPTITRSGRTSKVSGIDLLGDPVEAAWTPQSVTLLLEDDIDVSRGDLIVPRQDAPATSQDVEATVCHVADAPLTVGHRVLLKHGTRTVKAIVKDIPARLTLDDLSLTRTPDSWSPTTSAA